MKKLFLILVVAGVTLMSCNAGQTKNNEEKQETAAVSASEANEEGAVGKLTKATFLQKVWDYENSPQEWKYKGDKPAIIDFYADWCGPCKIAAPILAEVAGEYAGKVNVYKVDTQVERELASVFGISSIPAFLYIPTEGKPVMINGIGRSKEQTKQMFEDNINKILLTSN